MTSVTLNTPDLQFARILTVDSDAPAAYMIGGGPTPPRQDTSALSVGQRGRPGLEAGAHTRTAPQPPFCRGKGGSVTNTHPTRQTTLYLQDAPAAAPATLAEAKAAV